MNTKTELITELRSRIKVLDDIVVNQIAAGEVVERPASVVKELVENSLDAGASEITIVLQNGGHSSIEVSDNGCGMSLEDAELCVERFATSKINSAADLTAIRTLGFRGEALSSIAAVSRFSLTSFAAGESVGAQVIVEGGKIKEVRNRARPLGTSITVANLYFNVPARKKFLKSERAETGQIRTLITDFALAYPSVRLKLIADGVELEKFNPSKNLIERAKELKLAGNKPFELIKDQETELPISIEALLSQPIEAVANSNRLRLIVNGRTVRDKILLVAVRNGFGNMLKGGSYPQGVLNLSLPANDLDVNVHPQKTEVRFRNPSALIGLISTEIRYALAKISPESAAFSFVGTKLSSAFPAASASRPDVVFEGKSVLKLDSGEVRNGFSVRELAGAYPVKSDSAVNLAFDFTGGTTSAVASIPGVSPVLSSMRFVGQIFRCYLLMEGVENFAIVDMHAAHERVRFADIKKGIAAGGLKSQGLMLAEIVELPRDRLVNFEEAQPFLRKLGFDCEVFGEDCISINAVPAILSNANPRTLFMELLSLPEWGSWEQMLGDRLDAIVARLACHSSIRSGRELNKVEVYSLLDQLAATESNAFCPHGRPIVKYFTKKEIETIFGRVM